mgnify:CR=1 FL=1
MAKKIVEKILRYNAIFEPAEEGGFVVTVPKLPGLVTEGDTFEEAMAMARDAIVGYLQVLQEQKEEIPGPDDGSITTLIDVTISKHKFAST